MECFCIVDSRNSFKALVDVDNVIRINHAESYHKYAHNENPQVHTHIADNSKRKIPDNSIYF